MDKPLYKTEVFEGPLDLLLFLITKHKLNINDIPILLIVEQYTDYVRSMQESNLEIASEFLEMAARLIYIKTVSLLPVQNEAEELKKELSAELTEFRDCKAAAQKLRENTDGFNYFTKGPSKFVWDQTYERLHEPFDILKAYLNVAGKNLRRMPPPIDSFKKIVAVKIIAVNEKIDELKEKLVKLKNIKFKSYLKNSESRSELIAKFLAVLELCKDKQILINGDGTDFIITSNEN